jgi:hypothetical protein
MGTPIRTRHLQSEETEMRDIFRRMTWMIVVAAACFAARPSLASEGGVSFWLPGNFGSLAAVPEHPAGRGQRSTITGRSLPEQASNSRAADASTSAISGTGRSGLLRPTYTFATPVWAGKRPSV